MSNRFCVEVKYLQSFVIIFSALIDTSLLVRLTDRYSANKEKSAKIKLSYDLDIAAHLYIIEHSKIAGYIFKSVKLKKRKRLKRVRKI